MITNFQISISIYDAGLFSLFSHLLNTNNYAEYKKLLENQKKGRLRI